MIELYSIMKKHFIENIKQEGTNLFLHWIPFEYCPPYRKMVLPLGIYTVLMFYLTQTVDPTTLCSVPSVFIYSALLSWIVTLSGLVYNSIDRFFLPII